MVQLIYTKNLKEPFVTKILGQGYLLKEQKFKMVELVEIQECGETLCNMGSHRTTKFCITINREMTPQTSSDHSLRIKTKG